MRMSVRERHSHSKWFFVRKIIYRVLLGGVYFLHLKNLIK